MADEVCSYCDEPAVTTTTDWLTEVLYEFDEVYGWRPKDHPQLPCCEAHKDFYAPLGDGRMEEAKWESL